MRSPLAMKLRERRSQTAARFAKRRGVDVNEPDLTDPCEYAAPNAAVPPSTARSQLPGCNCALSGRTLSASEPMFVDHSEKEPVSVPARLAQRRVTTSQLRRGTRTRRALQQVSERGIALRSTRRWSMVGIALSRALPALLPTRSGRTDRAASSSERAPRRRTTRSSHQRSS